MCAVSYTHLDSIRVKIVVDSTVLEQVSSFEYLSYNLSYITDNGVVSKLNKFNHMGVIIRRTLKLASKEKVGLWTEVQLRVKLRKFYCYESENLILRISQTRLIQATKIRFFRQVAGYTLMIIEETQAGTEHYEYTRQDYPILVELVGTSLANGWLPHPQTTVEL